MGHTGISSEPFHLMFSSVAGAQSSVYSEASKGYIDCNMLGNLSEVDDVSLHANLKRTILHFFSLSISDAKLYLSFSLIVFEICCCGSSIHSQSILTLHYSLWPFVEESCRHHCDGPTCMFSLSLGFSLHCASRLCMPSQLHGYLQASHCISIRTRSLYMGHLGEERPTSPYASS